MMELGTIVKILQNGIRETDKGLRAICSYEIGDVIVMDKKQNILKKEGAPTTTNKGKKEVKTQESFSEV